MVKKSTDWSFYVGDLGFSEKYLQDRFDDNIHVPGVLGVKQWALII